MAMSYKPTLVFLLICCHQSLAAEDHDHDHGSSTVGRNMFVSEIAETLSVTKKNAQNRTVFAFKDLKAMWNVLGFVNCSDVNIASNCQRCIGPTDFYNFNNKSTGSLLTNAELQEFLPSIIYFMLPVNSSTPCSSADVRLKKQIPNGAPTSIPNAYKLLLRDYGKGQASLQEAGIESMLENINKSIHHLLTEKKCFDVDEVIKDSNVTASAIPEHDFEYVSAYIIWKILGKHCITEHVPSLPSKEFFINQIVSEFGTNGELTLDQVKELFKKLKLGNLPAATSTTHDTHDHKRRRRSTEEQLRYPQKINRQPDATLHRSRRSTPAQNSAFAKRCYTTENVFQIYGHGLSSKLNSTQFTELCPALVQQIESGACAQTKTTSKLKETGWKPWVATLVSVTIISLFSLVGIVAAPLNRKSYFSRILTIFIALGVGTLLGDAILHLLPHSMGLHKHDGDAHADVKSSDSFVWKSLVFIAGVYAFYLFEACMHSMSEHGHSHGLEDTHKHLGRMPSHSKQVKGGIELNESEGKNQKQRHLVKAPSGVHQCDSTVSLPENGTAEYAQRTSAKSRDRLADGSMSQRNTVIGNMRGVVGMILFGDALHNFVDGVAIGVSFTQAFPSGLYGGISTSIAILCHELPHELGDLAILLNSGMPIKTALILNFISSLTAIIGGCVGVAAGQQLSALPWIFAITAGLFVYIALVDMLPELLHSSDLRKNPCRAILLQSVGLLTGFAIMSVLALYEEDIRIKN